MEHVSRAGGGPRGGFRNAGECKFLESLLPVRKMASASMIYLAVAAASEKPIRAVLRKALALSLRFRKPALVLAADHELENRKYFPPRGAAPTASPREPFLSLRTLRLLTASILRVILNI